MVTVRFFGELRESLSVASEGLDLPAKETSVEELLERLRARGGSWSEGLGAHKRVLCAVNQAYAEPSVILKDGDEVAFFPPVTGG